MTLTEPAVQTQLSARAVAVLAGFGLLVILAHGCHGADEDHEPAVTPVVDRE